MEDYTDLTKQIEGNSLALSAVAEILSKMDAKLSRDEESVLAKEEADNKAADRESLVADITKSVLESIQAHMNVEKAEMDDDEDAGDEIANPEPGMEAVQEPVLAKEHTDEHMHDEEEKEEEDDDMEKGMGKKYSMKSDEDGEDIEKSLREKIADLEKALEDTDGRIEKAVARESEARLRKMGFREETGLKAPVSRSLTPAGTQASLGVEEAPYISKGAEPTNTEDVISQLSQLSFKQLRDMQEQLESGNTEGIPQELLNN